MFDVVVVGGGLAGLYAAYKLSLSGRRRVGLVERDAELGGRAKTVTFAHTTVPTGAGIGRKAKDVRLQRLTRALGVPVREFPVVHHTSLSCAVKTAFGSVRAAYEALAEPRPQVTFRAFAQQVLGPEAYRDLVACSGYSDYEGAAVADVLYAYGFEDNYEDWTGLGVPWAALINALAKSIVAQKCAVWTGCAVITMAPLFPGWRLGTSRGDTLRTRRVVIATDVATIRRLMPWAPLFRHVHAQPFVRTYALFSGASAAAMKAAVRGTTVVRGPLQKLIPMSDAVYMVAYADNAAAVHMRSRAHDRPGVARLIEAALGLPALSLRIDAMRTIFIPRGTHYNDPQLYAVRGDPARALQHPGPGVYVVGEAVSRHQGWVEGALESVDAVC